MHESKYKMQYSPDYSKVDTEAVRALQNRLSNADSACVCTVSVVQCVECCGGHEVKYIPDYVNVDTEAVSVM
jgi:hypothetical protein